MKRELNQEQSSTLNHLGQYNKDRLKEQLFVAKKEGIIIKKMWMTSVWFETHKPKICEKHLPYEKLGYVDLNYEYAPGLKFPFDPDCNDPEEFNNCNCYYLTKVIIDKSC